MALTLETTYNSEIPDIPTGASAAPTTITFSGSEFKTTYEHTLAASGVENADPALGFDALVSAIDTYVSGTYVPSVLGLDTVANNYDAIAEIRVIDRNNGTSKYSNTDNFVVTFTFTAEIV